ADMANGQSIGPGIVEEIVGSLAATTAVHILANDGRATGNIFLQIGGNQFDARISGSAGIATLNESNSLALIIRGLRVNLRAQADDRHKAEKPPCRIPCQAHFILLSISKFYGAVTAKPRPVDDSLI